jgi:hypothetical protein
LVVATGSTEVCSPRYQGYGQQQMTRRFPVRHAKEGAFFLTAKVAGIKVLTEEKSQ